MNTNEYGWLTKYRYQPYSFEFTLPHLAEGFNEVRRVTPCMHAASVGVNMAMIALMILIITTINNV